MALKKKTPGRSPRAPEAAPANRQWPTAPQRPPRPRRLARAEPMFGGRSAATNGMFTDILGVISLPSAN